MDCKEVTTTAVTANEPLRQVLEVGDDCQSTVGVSASLQQPPAISGASLESGKSPWPFVRHMTMVKSGQAVRSKDDEQLKEASDFRKLLDSECTYRVNCFAVNQLNVHKRLHLHPIPLTEDLLTVRNYVSNAMVECQSQLTRNPHTATWTRLAKLTMTRLIMFNKRRRAEVKDMTVKQYMERPNWKKIPQANWLWHSLPWTMCWLEGT